MSITRIVAGQMNNKSTGKVELWAKDGNFEINAASTNEWKGEDEGILETNYDPLDERDTMDDSLGNLTISIFFDGTLNNRENTEARLGLQGNDGTEAYNSKSNKKDDSYENDYSNVARAYNAALNNEEHRSVYAEGIGTETFEEDSNLPGAAFGGGDTGVVGKVKKGCKAIGENVTKLLIKNYDILYINVFGFSRGAAAARHFLSVANKKIACGRVSKNEYNYTETGERFTYESDVPSLILKNGLLDFYLIKNGLKYNEIKFQFAGLYDTVSSYWFPHFDDVSQLDLKAVKHAQIAYQIQSADEYRFNFDITNIKSTMIGGVESVLPGVHSDVGGSYRESAQEESLLHIGTENSCIKFQNILIEEGWFTKGQLFVKKTDTDYMDALINLHEALAKKDKRYWIGVTILKGIRNTIGSIYRLEGSRCLENTYDKIPLISMFTQSNKYMKYDETRKSEYEEINDIFIKKVQSQLNAYLNEKVANHRNKYVNQYNENLNNNNKLKQIEKQYMQETLNFNYRDYIDREDLKRLRNQYLHWSANILAVASIPRTFFAQTEDKRKRTEQDG